MKLFGAVFVAFLAVGPLSAQYWPVGGFGSVVFPGLGHAPAGGNPWGNVVSPGIPQGAVVSSSGAGLVASGRYGGTGHSYRHGNSSAFMRTLFSSADTVTAPATAMDPRSQTSHSRTPPGAMRRRQHLS